MDGLNWLLGFTGAIISIGVLIGAAMLGWRILRSTIELLRTAARPSLWTLLYYGGVLMLILVVVSVFIPLFFSSLATGIRESRNSAQDISIELNSWIIQSIENAKDGGYGAFPTSPPPTPWGGNPYPTTTPTPYVVPIQPSPTYDTEVGAPTASAPVATATATPVPTINTNTWNFQTPPPTPIVGE